MDSLRLFRRTRHVRRDDNIEMTSVVANGSGACEDIGNGQDIVVDIVPAYRDLLLFTNRSHSLMLAVGVTSAVVNGIFYPAVALLVGKVFGLLSGYATGESSADELVGKVAKYSTYLAAIGAGSLVVHAIFFASWIAFGELQAKAARDRLFASLLNQNIGWFDKRKEGPSALIPRLNAQIRDLQLAASQPLGFIISIISNAIFALGLAFYSSWKLTLVIMASIPALIVFIILTNRPMGQRGSIQQSAKTEALKAASNALEAIDTVKCNNAQKREAQRYGEKIAVVARWFRKTVNINALQQGFAAALAGLMFVQAFYYGGVLVRSGQKNPGDVVTTFASALSVFTSLNSISQQMLVIEVGRIAGAKMKAIMADIKRVSELSQKLLISSPTAHIEPDELQRGTLLFDSVTFAYPTRPDENVLKNLSLAIPMGQLSFVVGASGSGKSTIGQLLARLYEPTSGVIKLAGIELPKTDPKHLRQIIALVEQESVLFNDSIKENIEMGLIPDPYNRGDVRDAIEFAALQLAIVDMPENDKTPVGACGERLSGGQRQRVALARTYMRNAPVLVLDESTSALDHIHRLLIMEAMRQWRRGKTTIMITHDIELINADEHVFVMSDGQLQCEGLKCELPDLEDPSSDTIIVTPTSPSFPSEPISPQSAISLTSSARTTVTPGPYMSHQQNADTEDIIDTYLSIDFASATNTTSAPWSSQLYAPRQRSTMALFTPALTRSESPTRSLKLLGQFPQKRHSATPDLSLQPSNSRNLEILAQQQKAANRSSMRSVASSRISAVMDRAGMHAAKLRDEYREARERRRESILLHHGRESPQLEEWEDPQSTMTLQAVLATVLGSISITQRCLLLLAIVLCGVQAASMPVMALLTTRMIATYSFAPDAQSKATVCAIAIIAVAIIDGISHYTLQRSFEYVAQAWVNSKRLRAMERMLDQPKDFFTKDRNTVSRLVETLDRYADDTRNILGRFTSLYTMATLQVMISVIWSLVTNWKLTLVTLSFFMLIFGLTRVFGAVSRRWEGKSNTVAEEINCIFVETFTCIKTVKLLTLEKHWTSKVSRKHREAYTTGLKRGMLTGLLYGLSEASETFAEAMIFYVAAKLTHSGMPVSSTIQVLLMLITSFAQVTMILAVIPQASMARDAATRFLRLTDLPKNSHEHAGAAILPAVESVAFRHVTFRYSPMASPALTDATFDIPPGKITCIVGPSGSGKSTVTKLLMRLHALGPTSGTILIGTRTLASLSVTSLRARIALVQQDNPILSASIADNIGYGIPGTPSPARLAAAADAAGLASTIVSLPQGYATMVGEGGLGLSGGQRQRLAIARALARDPDMLVLDEATSAVDGSTAARIRESLVRFVARGRAGGRVRSVLCVTHDRRMMEGADWVVVMEAGRVVEQGTFRGLMREGGALVRLLRGG